MSVTERERLAPSTFRLPVEKIRDGYYSDAYFNHTKALLEADGHHPHVVMQVFQREESILGGVDEAIAVLKQGAGHRGAGGRWVDGFEELEVRALHEGDALVAVGDRDDDRGRLLAVRPPRDGLPGLHGPPHAGHAQRPPRGRGRAGQADPLLPRPPRPLARADRRRLGRARAGAIGVSTDAQASWWGGRGVGTVPHGLIAAYGGDTVRASRLFAARFAGEMNVTVLVDFANDSVETALEVAEALGSDLWGVRLDTSDKLADLALQRLHGDAAPKGVAPELVALTREQLDAHGFRDVKIVVSGGFTADRIHAFEAAGVPVDAYGVGSSLLRGANDFTADVVMVDGKPGGKVGRELRPNDRLSAVR